VTEQPLFGGAAATVPAAGDARVIITVKAAPNPSAHYGETVCVAGIKIDDDGSQSWIRLYPINFRALEQDKDFSKYDVVRVPVTPVNGAGGDNRRESHRPDMAKLAVESHLKDWTARRPWIEPMVTGDACALSASARANSSAPSLALIRPMDVLGFDIEPHPGWSGDDQRSIDAYVNQLTLFGNDDRRPLEAPRFKGWYVYRCHAPGCTTHRQQVLDWEFVRLQRRHAQDDDTSTATALRARFLEMMCGPRRDPAFFLGNLSKRRFTFSTLGCYYPEKQA
jgi:hypothetical protein